VRCVEPVLLACIALVTGAAPPESARSRRTWDPGAWVEVAALRDARGDHLLNPQRLALCGTHVVVLDFEDPHVTAFVDGTFKWRFGREGSGPAEFRTPGSVSCDASGRLWVPDRGNGRIQIIASDGGLASSLPTELSVRRLAPTPNGSAAWAVSSGSTELALRLNASGIATLRVPLPTWLAKYNSLQRESFITAAPDGGALVSFRWASTLIRVSPIGKADTLRESAQPIGFPEFRAYKADDGKTTMLRIHPSAREATRGLFVTREVIAVLAVDQEDPEGTILDRYRMDGTYLGSRRLPKGTRSATGTENDVYVLVNEPIPSLLRLRWKPSSQ
jgi:hypothetical protein